MDSLLSQDSDSQASRIEDYSLLHLLQQALLLLHTERHSEGILLLRLACERLVAGQEQLASIINPFLEGYGAYQAAQLALQEASQHFVVAHSAQQARQADLVARLTALTCNASHTNTRTDCVPRAQSEPGLSTGTGDQPALPSLQARASFHENGMGLPALSITCFGRFEVRRLGETVNLCASRGGQSIFRYLVVKDGRCATSDVLQNLLWADDEPEVGQNKLHIAISALRRSLNRGYACTVNSSYVLYKHGRYYLNPAVSIVTDVDEFLHYYQAGRQAGAEQAALYERGCNLYTGPFLVEDLYADWSFLQREQLSRAYLIMCRSLVEHYFQQMRYEEAAKWANAILAENRCDESAYRKLIQIYAAQGRRSEALQQYQRCEQTLRHELGIPPLPETTQLLRTLLAN